ncbi:MAG: DUF1836 domain-containing protein [Clostridia bacterium]|nr:DUF1836 domain-containing protein [Clostridia bacterium]MBR6754750.1 DUF1836 domain-containing protein [Clostridia bacterium]
MIPKTEELINFRLPRYEEFPVFELYIDQVISFISESLSVFNRGDEVIITQAMINNYVKNGVIPAPIKKKYNREHLAKLVVICVSKRMLPLSYISEAIMLMSRFFEIEEGYNIFCDEVEYEIKSTVKPEKYPVRTIAEAGSNKVGAMRSLASVVAKTLVFDKFIEQRRRLSAVAERLLKN